jgi:energy-coupling factor transporter ATP-binding protein EcfA2
MTLYNGLSASCKVVVYDRAPCESIQLASEILNEGNTYNLSTYDAEGNEINCPIEITGGADKAELICKSAWYTAHRLNAIAHGTVELTATNPDGSKKRFEVVIYENPTAILLNETEVRSALGAFLFSGEDVFKCVDDLSGGEKVRLALCKMFKRRPNVLIMDEPTNHMDIVGKETLENMLSEYQGTLIVVSHDRYFINKVADKLLVFENGDAKFYPYGFSEYELIEKENAEKQATIEIEQKTATSQAGAKKSFSTPLKDKSKKERRVKKLEELISQSEEKICALNQQLEDPKVYSDYVKVNEIQGNLANLQNELDAYSEEWFVLTEELEGN